MHEWGGPSSGNANAYRHIARKERMDGWQGGTNILDYLTLGTSNKEYTFIFRAGDSSQRWQTRPQENYDEKYNRIMLRLAVEFHERLSSEIKDEISSKLASALRCQGP